VLVGCDEQTKKCIAGSRPDRLLPGLTGQHHTTLAPSN
jgi:hypothetical protein